MSTRQEWFQANKQKILIGLLCLLIASIGFGLGYLSARNNDRAPIIIEQNS